MAKLFVFSGTATWMCVFVVASVVTAQLPTKTVPTTTVLTTAGPTTAGPTTEAPTTTAEDDTLYTIQAADLPRCFCVDVEGFKCSTDSCGLATWDCRKDLCHGRAPDCGGIETIYDDACASKDQSACESDVVCTWTDPTETATWSCLSKSEDASDQVKELCFAIKKKYDCDQQSVCELVLLPVTPAPTAAPTPPPTEEPTLAPTSAPTKYFPELIKEQCKIKHEYYKEHFQIQEQCLRLADWETSKQMLGNSADADCEIDETTLKMQCEQVDKCTGGDTIEQEMTVSHMRVTYDCGGRCGSGYKILTECCDTCLRFRSQIMAKLKKGTKTNISDVECRGCEIENQDKVKNAEAACQLTGSKFECGTRQSCDVGQPNPSTYDESFKCNVIQCDNCEGNLKMQAGCCAACLKQMCKGNNGRYACQGCITPPMKSNVLSVAYVAQSKGFVFFFIATVMIFLQM